MTGSFRTPRRYELPEGFLDAVGAAEDTLRWQPSAPDAAARKQTAVATNAELVRELVERVGMSKTDASKALDVMVEVMVQRLSVGGSVRLKNFGTFKRSRGFAGSKQRALTVARKRAAGAKAADAVQFIPGAHLRHVIDEDGF